MSMFDYVYTKLHKYVLISIGLWPDQSKLAKRLSFTTYTVSAVSLLVPMSVGLSDKWSTDPVIVLENILSIIYIATAYVTCSILYLQDEQISQLHKKIHTDWKSLFARQEIKILKEFTREGQKIAITYVLYGVPTFAIFGAITFIPPLVNTPANGLAHTFPHYFKLMIINEDVRFYQVSLHTLFVFIYVGFSYLGISSTFISSVKHVCGIYSITWLQKAIEPSMYLTVTKLRNEKSIILNLINVINKHREAIHGVNMIEEIFSGCFLIMEVSALLGMAIAMVDIMTNKEDPFQVFRVLLVISIFLMYMFYINWAGEQIVQISNRVCLTAYFIDWFTISIEARELLHMIIRRSCKTDKLTAGSFVILSVQNFGKILTTSWSTATVLYSTQKIHK